MVFDMTKDEIIQKLADLNAVIDKQPRDTAEFHEASTEMSRLTFGTIGMREVAFIVDALGRPLTNPELADLIIASEAHRPLNTVISLPAEADAAYTIKYRRKQAGMTQVDLAKKIGIEQSQLAKIENGQLRVCLNLLQRAMTVFGTSYVVKAL
jgi:DNA-binding XRE family transcriptional regulator